MSVINNLPVEQGSALRGIEREYYAYAGESIKAGDFVTFMENAIATNNTMPLLDLNGVTGCLIDANKAFVCYWDNKDLLKYRGRIITIDGNNMSFGPEFSWGEFVACNATISCCTLDANRVLIAYCDDKTDYGEVIIATINGTTITFGASYTYSTTASYGPRAVYKISSTQVMLIWRNTGNTKGEGRAVVLNISGDAITSQGSSYMFTNMNFYYGYIKKFPSCQLTTSKYVVGYRYYNNSYVGTCRAMILNVSGTTVSAGSYVTTSSEVADHYDICAMGSSYFLFSYENDGYSSQIYSFASTSSPSKGSEINTCNVNYMDTVFLESLSSTSALHLATDGSEHLLYARILIRSSSSLSLQTVYNIDETMRRSGYIYRCLIKINDSKILVIDQAGIFILNINGNVITRVDGTTTYETQVKKISDGLIAGVAQSNMVGGDHMLHNQKGIVLIPEIGGEV